MDLQTSQRNIIDHAHRIAAEKARVSFLADETRANVLGIGPKQLHLLRHMWDPFEVRYEWNGNYGLGIKAESPEVRKLMLDAELWRELNQIVVDSFQEAIADSKETRGFVETLLTGMMR